MTTLFETFLLELAIVLHFPTLAPDKQGACLVVMKADQIPLLFEFDDRVLQNTILVSTPITPLIIDRAVELYKACLIGNSSMEETLSVRPDEDMIYLHRRLHPSIAAGDLKAILEIFLESTKTWKVKLKQMIHQPPKSQKQTSSL